MVTWSLSSKADLRRIFEFIACDSPHYARKVTLEIVEKIDILNDLPRLGRVVPEIGDESVREISLYTYRIIYEIRNQDVHVLAIVHKRRDFRGGDAGKPKNRGV